MDVSAIVIHFGDEQFTRHVVDCLRERHDGLALEIIVVDNASHTPLDFAMNATEIPLRMIRVDADRGYGAACNSGASEARGRHILILNNDLDIPENALGPLVTALDSDPSIGAAGPMLRFPDGRFQLSWGDDPTLRSEVRERDRQRESRSGGIPDRANESMAPRDVDWITGAVMMIPHSAWNKVGGFDEGFFFYFEDADLCRRLRMEGYRIRYVPATSIVHFGGGSNPLSNPRIIRAYRREQLRYYARYNSLLEFSLLKLYLLAKFMIIAAFGPLDRATSRTLLTDILRFRRRDGALPDTGVRI